jgi:predicted Zn finger-like uncharacterized protein
LQANCPSCSNKIVIDDARVPDRPFGVKCPKCATVVKFPGKAAAAAAAPPAAEAAPAPAEPEPASAPNAAADTDQMRAQMMAQLRREISASDTPRERGRALVALMDRAHAGSMTLPLTRQGFEVDTIDNPEEGGRLLEQGVYELVVTSRVAASAGKESLYQRMNRLSPDSRRSVFVVLVGDEFKSGDGTQAFVCLADLVIHTRDIASCDSLLVNVMAERDRLYRAYLDARHRHEAAAAL